MKHKLGTIVAIAIALALAVAAAAISKSSESAVVKPKGELTWIDMGVPGVSAAVVSGDLKKGPVRFYLKYGTGFVAPAHHHTPDHRGTVVSGTLSLTVGDKTYTLPAGSYFELNNKAVHSARVEGTEDAVMFIEADGAWDAVMAK